MARSPAPLPIDLRFGAFRTSRSSTDTDPNRFRRRDVVQITRGAAVVTSAFDAEERIRGFGLVLGPSQRFSHATAALVLGLPLPARLQADDASIHVTTNGDGPIMRRRGVVGHRDRAARAGTDLVRGLRVGDPASTWYECRTLLTVEELVAVGDHLVGVAALATIDDLRARCRPGDVGVRVARLALERIRVGAESPMETAMRLLVVDAGLPEPDLHVAVHDPEGRFLGRADMVWPAERVALEYDGDHHRTDRGTFHGDRRRGNGFAANGWIVIRATSADLRDPAPMLARLGETLRSRQLDVSRVRGVLRP
jgi:very-short-patch-repair endonuclease